MCLLLPPGNLKNLRTKPFQSYAITTVKCSVVVVVVAVKLYIEKYYDFLYLFFINLFFLCFMFYVLCYEYQFSGYVYVFY